MSSTVSLEGCSRSRHVLASLPVSYGLCLPLPLILLRQTDLAVVGQVPTSS